MKKFVKVILFWLMCLYLNSVCVFAGDGNTYAFLCGGSEIASDPIRNDINGIDSVLKKNKLSDNVYTTIYTATSKSRISDINKTMSRAYKNCTKNDVAVFYYSGHGLRYGRGLYINKNAKYSCKNLIKRLNKIKAKKVIVIIDACYSGTFYKYGLSTLGTEDRKKFVLFLSSNGDETSGFTNYGGKSFSRYSNTFSLGLGRDGKVYADTNKDGIVTAPELSSYLNLQMKLQLIQGPDTINWSDVHPVFYAYTTKDSSIYKYNLPASLKLNRSSATIYTSGNTSVKLSAALDGKTVNARWSSNNTSVAKVDSTGKVTAKKAGVATIAATANGVTAKCTVTVKDNRSSSGKNYKCIMTSGSDASKRKVGNVTFSWKSQYINGSGTYNSIYVTKGNKTTLVARMKELSAYVISDGQEVFYSAGREQSTVYRKKLSDKKASSVFRKRTDYGFGLSLSGFYNNTLYYVDGIDPGKFRSYSLSSKRHSTILGDTASVEQKNEYFYLQPSFGDVGYRSRLSVYNAKTKKTQLISDRLNVMFEYKIIGNMLYYVEHTGVSNYYRSPYTISVKRCKLDGSGKTTLVSGLTVREIRSLDSRSISYLDGNGYRKTKFY